MSDTTTLGKKKETDFDDLIGRVPETETDWRSIAARAHRLRKFPGDEAAAKTHEIHIWEIREGLLAGTSREIRFCPRCLEKGNKYMLLFMGGIDRCGSCSWPAAQP
jgi:hypothetical protein